MPDLQKPDTLTERLYGRRLLTRASQDTGIPKTSRDHADQGQEGGAAARATPVLVPEETPAGVRYVRSPEAPRRHRPVVAIPVLGVLVLLGTALGVATCGL